MSTDSLPTPYAIVAGFGLPGREAVNLLSARGVPYIVVELNPQTVTRTSRSGLSIVQGDIAEDAVLRAAGVEHAKLLLLAIPDDAAVLRAIEAARRINPSIRIVARCRRVSTAIEATRRGADHVLSEEQIVGAEFARLAAPYIPAEDR